METASPAKADPAADAGPARRHDVDQLRIGVIDDMEEIEFAGVLRGARNVEGARKLVDFMLSPRFQAGMPLTMS